MSDAVLGRREQNKLEKRGRIIASARALFTHKGFEATTSQEIAEAAGVAAGTVFTYAKSKDDLLILVFHNEMLKVVEKAAAAASRQSGLVDQAIAFFETMVVYHERDLPLARALMRQLGYVSSAEQRSMVDDLMKVVYRHLAQLVETAVDKGEVMRGISLLPCARSLFAIYYLHLGSMLSGYFGRTQFDRVLRTDLSLLLSGLQTDARRAKL